MLISTNVDHAAFLGGARAMVVDALHAFASDDRGWHLLAVLERLVHLTGTPIQRIGLSAAIGNPDDLLAWLQGSARHQRPAQVVSPPPAGPHRGSPRDSAQVELDYVGSLPNAATVVAALHHGEKRLAFRESRRQVEELAHLLRGAGITTFLSHA
jgi:ATP-dependent Lhr-like helicase